jgi:hypothetical protein
LWKEHTIWGGYLARFKFKDSLAARSTSESFCERALTKRPKVCSWALAFNLSRCSSNTEGAMISLERDAALGAALDFRPRVTSSPSLERPQGEQPEYCCWFLDRSTALPLFALGR